MLKLRELQLSKIGYSLRMLSAKSQPFPFEEYTEKPEYPEILDTSHESKVLRKKQSWYEQIKNLKTVEEKQIKINMPRYYGYKVVALNDTRVRYNSLPMIQHYTRTLLQGNDKLPDASESEQVNSLVKAISGEFQESVEYAIQYFKEKFGDSTDLSPHLRENEFSQIMVEIVNRTLINSLAADYPHLFEAEVDINPRHEASWFVGGVRPPNNIRKIRKGVEWRKETADNPVDRGVHYKGSPYLTVRHKHILPAIISQEEFISAEEAKNVPVYDYDARSLGYSTDYKHLVNIPGYWPGSKNKFGIVSYQKRDHMLLKTNSTWKPGDFEEALHSQGILSSFAWTFAQACYQGFTTYNDLTYPINTQTIITDGQNWSFYQYQLNTTLVHSDNYQTNPKTNHCWGTGELKLYEKVDDNGKLVGFNEEVLKHLVKVYIRTPKESDNDLTPYLGKNEKNVADIPEEERREFLENSFKYISSNRPRHLALPEIYNWEKIYKIDNKQRSMEPKRRFFELGINPWARTLDQHCQEYIPKIVRPDGVKSKHKFKKHYYP